MNDTDTETTAKAAGLVLGAGLLGRYMGKHHKSHSEKVRNDWLWQEKYRPHDDHGTILLIKGNHDDIGLDRSKTIQEQTTLRLLGYQWEY